MVFFIKLGSLRSRNATPLFFDGELHLGSGETRAVRTGSQRPIRATSATTYLTVLENYWNIRKTKDTEFRK